MCTINAQVLRVFCGRLLVRDRCTNRVLQVYAPGADCLMPGECVCIRFYHYGGPIPERIVAFSASRIAC